jgi:hypothetical protein
MGGSVLSIVAVTDELEKKREMMLRDVVVVIMSRLLFFFDPSFFVLIDHVHAKVFVFGFGLCFCGFWLLFYPVFTG